jgi:hypothetical protein
MTLEEALAQLESLGHEKVRAQNRRHGAGDNQFAPIWINEMVRRQG